MQGCNCADGGIQELEMNISVVEKRRRHTRTSEAAGSFYGVVSRYKVTSTERPGGISLLVAAAIMVGLFFFLLLWLLSHGQQPPPASDYPTPPFGPN